MPCTPDLVGAVLCGAAFTCFTCTTLLASAARPPTYDALCARLGLPDSVHGTLMVIGGLMFASSMLRARYAPQASVWCFAVCMLANVTAALLPASDILQTAATAPCNACLTILGHAVQKPPKDSLAISPVLNPRLSPYSISRSSVTVSISPCLLVSLSAAGLRVTNDLDMERPLRQSPPCLAGGEWLNRGPWKSALAASKCLCLAYCCICDSSPVRPSRK